MASFQAKTGWETSRKRENKNYRSDQFQPDPDQRISKNSKKIQKIKTFHYNFFSSKNRLGKAEKETKIIVPINSYQTCNRKFQKNSKNYKTPLGLLFEPKHVEEGREREKIKIIVPISSNPDPEQRIQKKKQQKKFKNLKYIIMASLQAKTSW